MCSLHGFLAPKAILEEYKKEERFLTQMNADKKG
jgi:hypothetical protein